MKYLILSLVLIFASQTEMTGSKWKAETTAKFVISGTICNSCCFSAINVLAEEFEKFGINHQIVIVDKELKKLKPLILEKCSLVDSVMIVENNEFNEIFPDYKNNDVYIVDKDNNTFYHFTDFTNAGSIQSIIKNTAQVKKHKIILPETTLKIISPYMTNDKDCAYFIDPINHSILKYSMQSDSLVEYYIPDKNAMFRFFDSTKYSISIWEETYKYSPNFIHFYFLYEYESSLNSLITILNGYNLDTLKKEAIWNQAISKLTYSDNYRITKYKEPNYQIYLKSGFTRYYTNLSDSVLALPALLTFTNTGIALLNLRKDSIEYFNSKDVFDLNSMNEDSIIFTANYDNKLIFYNYKNKILQLFSYYDGNFKKLINKKIISKANDSYELFEMLAYKNNLYMIYFNDEQLYVEEYSVDDDVTFSKSFSLRNDSKYLQNISFIKVDNNFLYMISSNEEDVYLLQEFMMN